MMQMFNKKRLTVNRAARQCQGRFTVALLLISIMLTAWTSMALASDSRLTGLLRGSLENAGVDLSELSFEEEDGVVTLSGRVLARTIHENDVFSPYTLFFQ